MKIAIGNDHSAVELKNIIVDFLKEKGIEVLNLGTDSSESCDYPVYGEKVGRSVEFEGGRHQRRVDMIMAIEEKD